MLDTIRVLWLREILRMFQEPSRMFGIVVQPLIFWFVIGSGFMSSFRMDESAVTYKQFFFPGIVAMVILFSAIFSTITLIEDRASGFLQQILVGPGGRPALVIGKLLGVATIALLQAALCFFVAPASGIILGNIQLGTLFAVIILGSLSMSAIGFIFAWWTQSSTAYHALMSVILIPMWILSGGMFPAKVSWMETLATLNPMGWLVAGLRAALSGGVADVGTTPPMLTLSTSLLFLGTFVLASVAGAVWVCEKRR